MILAAVILPYATVFAAKRGGRIDNSAPRVSLEKLKGWARRADWAHRNHFEA
ncbi:MAG: MAPEG family protein, partial [Stellaceae bacterium]